MQKTKPKKPPQCEHIKTNGLRCGSPALRTRRHCCYHERAHDLRRLRRQRPETKLHIPLLEDANAIQIAIQEVVEAIAEDRIDPKRAGLMLYALQTASSNLKKMDTEPQQLREQLESDSQISPIVNLLIEELGLDLDGNQRETKMPETKKEEAPAKKPALSEPLEKPDAARAASSA